MHPDDHSPDGPDPDSRDDRNQAFRNLHDHNPDSPGDRNRTSRNLHDHNPDSPGDRNQTSHNLHSPDASLPLLPAPESPGKPQDSSFLFRQTCPFDRFSRPGLLYPAFPLSFLQAASEEAADPWRSFFLQCRHRAYRRPLPRCWPRTNPPGC